MSFLRDVKGRYKKNGDGFVTGGDVNSIFVDEQGIELLDTSAINSVDILFVVNTTDTSYITLYDSTSSANWLLLGADGNTSLGSAGSGINMTGLDIYIDAVLLPQTATRDDIYNLLSDGNDHTVYIDNLDTSTIQNLSIGARPSFPFTAEFKQILISDHVTKESYYSFNSLFNKPPLFSLDANSYKTRFDETAGDIVKINAGRGLSFVKDSAYQAPLLNEGRFYFSNTAGNAVVSCDDTDDIISGLEKFTISANITLSSVTDNDFVILAKGDVEGAITPLLFHFVNDDLQLYIRDSLDNFYSLSVDIDTVAECAADTEYSVYGGYDGTNLWIWLNNKFFKTVASPTGWYSVGGDKIATGQVNSLVTAESVIANEIKFYDYSVLDSTKYANEQELTSRNTSKSVPSSILKPVSVLNLDFLQRTYCSAQPSIDKWVDVNGLKFSYTNGTVTRTKPLKTDDGVEFLGAGYGLVGADNDNLIKEENFSICGLVYIDTQASTSILFKKGKIGTGVPADFSFSVSVSATNQLIYTQFDATSSDNLTSNSLTNGWYFYAIGRDTANAERWLFINNKYYSTANLATSAINNTERDVEVGLDFTGKIKELKYFPYSILDASQYTDGQTLSPDVISTFLSKREGLEISHRDRSVIENTGTTITSIKDLLYRKTLTRASVFNMKNDHLQLIQGDDYNYSWLADNNHNFTIIDRLHLSFKIRFDDQTIGFGPRGFWVGFAQSNTPTIPRMLVGISYNALGNERYDIAVNGATFSTAWEVKKDGWRDVTGTIVNGVLWCYIDGEYKLGARLLNPAFDYSSSDLMFAGTRTCDFTDVRVSAYPETFTSSNLSRRHFIPNQKSICL